MTKNECRELFSHHKNGEVYLNHAAISPMPNATADAIRSFLDSRQNGPVEDFENWMNVIEETRQLIAKLIHTEFPEQITFMGNTSDGISAVAESLPWEPDDEILLNTMEFPSNVQPFRALERKGVTIKYIKPENGMVTPDMIRSAISPKTKLVSISAVQYLNGFRADLEGIGRVCRERDLWFVVDGIQALGASDINVQMAHIDALATGGHKWLMSPMGTGFLYLSEKLSGKMTPSKTGWLSVEEPWELSNFDQPWLPVNQHLETGTMNMAGIVGMHSSINMFLKQGMDTIREEILTLTGELMDMLDSRSGVKIVTPTQKEMRSGIVAFSRESKSEPDDVVQSLKNQNIIISARQGLFRISPHFYNTIEEIERAVNQLFRI